MKQWWAFRRGQPVRGLEETVLLNAPSTTFERLEETQALPDAIGTVEGLAILGGVEYDEHEQRRRKRRIVTGSGRMGRLLRKRLGIDEDLIADLPDDKAIYTRIMLQVLLTATLAFCAMSVAVSMALRSTTKEALLASAACGAIFAGFVALMDISIVSPRASEDHSDANERRSRWIRITIAVCLGVMISFPLTAALFHSEAEEVLTNRAEQRRSGMVTAKLQSTERELLDDIKAREEAIPARRTYVDELRDECTDGACTSAQISTLSNEEASLWNAQAAITGLNDELARARAAAGRSVDAELGEGADGFGVMARIGAAHEGVGWGPSIAVLLFLVAIDLAPVLMSFAHQDTEYQRRLTRRRITERKRHDERERVADSFWGTRVKAATKAAEELGRTSVAKDRDRIGLDPDASLAKKQGEKHHKKQEEQVIDLTDDSEATGVEHKPGDRWRWGNEFYKLYEKIGQGGMAEVWMVHPASQRPTAANIRKVVKVPRRYAPMNSEAAMFKQMRREIDHYAQFQNKHVPRVYDVVTPDDVPYFFMDLYPATSMDRWYFGYGCDDHRFNLWELREWVQSLRAALIELWGLSRAWIDGKPQNVLMRLDGEQVAGLLIADFGGISPFGELESKAAASSTFTAPEVQAQGIVSCAADIYSMGATLYFMVSGGWAPWLDIAKERGLDPRNRSVLLSLMEGPPTPLRELSPARTAVPEALERLILRWLSPDPIARLLHDNDRSLTKADLLEVGTVAQRLGLQTTQAWQELVDEVGEAELKVPRFGQRHHLLEPFQPPVDLGRLERGKE